MYILFICAIILFVLLLIIINHFIPKYIFHYDESCVKRVIILNGKTGYTSDISDVDRIHELIQYLNSTSFKRNGFIPIKGFSYKIYLYDYDNKRIDCIILRGSNNITYHKVHYKTNNNDINLAKIVEIIIGQED